MIPSTHLIDMALNLAHVCLEVIWADLESALFEW